MNKKYFQICIAATAALSASVCLGAPLNLGAICEVVNRTGLESILGSRVVAATVTKGVTEDDCSYTTAPGEIISIARITGDVPKGMAEKILMQVPSTNNVRPIPELGDGAVINHALHQLAFEKSGRWWRVVVGVNCPYGQQSTPKLSFGEIDRKCSEYSNNVAIQIGKLVREGK